MVFNFATLVQAFEAMLQTSMNNELNKYVQFMLNEAYNYSVYKSLSFKGDKNTRNKNSRNKNTSEEEIVSSGPWINDVENDANNSFTNYYSQDRGLDLPNTV